jgi:N-hydroxyarylamine O-acetyltransferase
MDPQRYFDRVRFQGRRIPSLETLSELQKCHVCNVPFENLDVQLGRSTSTGIEAAFEKIVVNGRGGWCYEQNGVFGWVLSQLGFEVMRLAGNVMREDRGEASAANHLALLVTIPGDSNRRYLVDVGFGGSLIAPIEFVAGEYLQPPFHLGLRQLDDGYWQFWEDFGDGTFSFDFLPQPANEAALSAKCLDLQTDPESGFVLNLIAQVRLPEQHLSLRGRSLRTVSAAGSDERVLQSADELVEVMRELFRLTDPELRDLWPQVVARHDQIESLLE